MHKTHSKKFPGIFWQIITIVILLMLLSSLGFAYYTYFIRIEKHENVTTIIEQKEVDDKSKRQIEFKNLSEISKQPVDNLEFLLNLKDANFTYDSPTTLVSTYYLDKDKEINSKVIFIKKENQKQESLGNITDLINKFKQKNVNTVIIDKSFLNEKNYFAFLEEIKKNSIKTFVVLPPKWGDEVDYENYKVYNNLTVLKLDYSKISEHADYIIIEGFNYTTPNSVLSGPIAPINWVELVIQYYISKDIPREKLILGINTFGYSWNDAEYTDNMYNNYILNEKIIINTLTFDKLKLYPNNLDKVDYENIYTENEIITVYPNRESIQVRIEKAYEFGLAGVFFL